MVGRLRPNAEARRRTRYYIFDLIAWTAQDENSTREDNR